MELIEALQNCGRERLQQLIDQACYEVAVEESEAILPVNFGLLDVRFLPFFLTGEKVRVEWNPDEFEDSDDIPQYKTFFVDLYLSKSQQRGVHHFPIFVPRYTNRRTQRDDIASGLPEKISDIQGIGRRDPRIPPKWPLKTVVRIRLADIYQYGNREKYGDLYEVTKLNEALNKCIKEFGVL